MPVEWDNPFTLTSLAGGDLDLNEPDGYRFLLDLANCVSSTDKRVSVDNIPQGDGVIPHRDFTGGFQLQMGLSLWVGEQANSDAGPACAADLVHMWDLLMLHLRSMFVSPGRVYWTPTGQPQRMADQVKLISGPSDTTSPRGQGGVSVIFTLLSPFPYALTAAQNTTTILDGATETLTNGGNTDFFPVIKVYGPTSAFTITNNSVLDEDGNPLQLVYSSANPGGQSIPSGHYGEFDFFKNTAYKDGSGLNLKPGITIPSSDFFPLAPGENDITVDGADADVLYNDAWWD